MYIFFICLAALIGGYLIYWVVAGRIFGAEPDRPNPVTTMEDGVDFVAMPVWRVFLIQAIEYCRWRPRLFFRYVLHSSERGVLIPCP